MGTSSNLHFYWMMLASLIVFLIVIRVVLTKQAFAQKIIAIILLSVIVVIIGMFFGKYGVKWGLKWWLYYVIPMLMTLLLPPLTLKMNKTQTVVYMVLAFLSAPVIHVVFSFFLGWDDYLPFWKIPSMKHYFSGLLA